MSARLRRLLDSFHHIKILGTEVVWLLEKERQQSDDGVSRMSTMDIATKRDCLDPQHLSTSKKRISLPFLVLRSLPSYHHCDALNSLYSFSIKNERSDRWHKPPLSFHLEFVCAAFVNPFCYKALFNFDVPPTN